MGTATTNINIRASKPARDLIDKAAKATGRNRSEFVLDVAQERAREILLDRTHFELGDEQHRRFQQLIDKPLPAKAAERLRRLLSHKAPWSR